VKKIFIVLVSVALLLFIFLTRPSDFPGYPRKSVSINDNQIQLIVADTEARKAQGLSGSAPLRDSEGMLFLFDAPGKYGFWMKDMKFSIDLIYIKNNTVVDIIYDARPDSYPTIFLPSKEFDSVIEVHEGVVKKKGINIGDNLRYNQ